MSDAAMDEKVEQHETIETASPPSEDELPPPVVTPKTWLVVFVSWTFEFSNSQMLTSI